MEHSAKGKRDRQRHYDARRDSPSKRGYDVHWKRLRKMKLTRDPVCETVDCGRPASEVDHVLPLAKGGENDWENLQSLCHPCHSRKTATEDGGFGR